jgi:4-aminobutyrate aminotransferase-like enzyme
VTDPSLGQLLPEIRTPLPGEACARYLEALAGAESPGLTPRRARGSERAGAEHDPIVWARASGANVMDSDGNRFVDLTAGFGAAAVGHRHPRVVEAIEKQADLLLHALGDLHPSEVKIRLLERLAGLAPFDDARVMLGLSGSDAVEAALKTALLATGKPAVVAFDGGYHGLSHGSLAACGYGQEFRRPFAAQLNPLVCFAPFPESRPGGDDRALLSRALAAVEQCCRSAPAPVGAVLIEPIQGRGGVREPVAGFLRALGAFCRQQGAVLIADEIFTGLGRSGAMWRSLSEVTPDIVCAGKALGGGLPVSACIGRSELMAAWDRQGGEALWAGTFFGHPLCCAAALAALDIIDREQLIDRSRESGEIFRRLLQAVSAEQPRLLEVRGRGLMIGLQLDGPGAATRLAHLLLQKGYLTVPAGARSDVLSLTPALNIDPGLLEGFADALRACLQAQG